MTRKAFATAVLGLAALLGVALTEQAAHGQVQPLGSGERPSADTLSPAYKYFSRGRQALAPPPQTRQRPVSVSPTLRPTVGKPFQNIQRGQRLSPYLSLDSVETSLGVPNYYSRVLPQLEQQQASRTQAAQLRQLQQQVRTAGVTGAITNSRSAGVPTTGHSTQFLNSGGYYPTVRR